MNPALLALLPRLSRMWVLAQQSPGTGETSIPGLDQVMRGVDHAAKQDGEWKFIALLVALLIGGVWMFVDQRKRENQRNAKLEARLENFERERTELMERTLGVLERLCPLMERIAAMNNFPVYAHPPEVLPALPAPRRHRPPRPHQG